MAMGLKKNHKKAIKWYTKSAIKGDPLAQVWLGYIYFHGEGVLQDHEQAVQWFTKAAIQGDAVAQLYLWACYTYGKGVLQDDLQAAEWFTKAVNQKIEQELIILVKKEVLRDSRCRQDMLFKPPLNDPNN